MHCLKLNAHKQIVILFLKLAKYQVKKSLIELAHYSHMKLFFVSNNSLFYLRKCYRFVIVAQFKTECIKKL